MLCDFLLPQISSLALAYNSCNRSGQEGLGTDRLGGGEEETWAAPSPSQPAEPFPLSQSPCCNTVVLPPQLPALSRTHNVCELCVNQSVGARPSQLGVLHSCSFFAMEAALDSFYLKERSFAQVASKASALCSNFLDSYSPFSYYTACCWTVSRGLLGLFGSPETPALPLDVAFSSHGKRQQEEPPRSMPHIEDRRGLLWDGIITGLRCHTNKTLNLYLLDSNLFWMYAERLGAPRLAPTKEFAVIVDLKEEVHYVLDQGQALLRSHLGMAWHGMAGPSACSMCPGQKRVSEAFANFVEAVF